MVPREEETHKTRECRTNRSQATSGTEKKRKRTRPGSVTVTDHRQPLVPRGRRDAQDQGVSQLQITGKSWYREEEETHKTRECHNYRSQITIGTERKRRRTRPGSITIIITGNPWFREEEDKYKTRECHNYRSQATPATERKKRRTRPGSVTITGNPWCREEEETHKTRECHNYRSQITLGTERKRRRRRPGSITITDHRQPLEPRGKI